MKQIIDPFYETTAWQEKRKKILRRDGYQDQHEKRYGRMRQAEVVHHIIPKQDHPELALEDWNLISLSKKSHNMMHDRNTDALTETGIELMERTCKKYNKEVPQEYRREKKKKQTGRKPNWRNYYD